MSVKKILKGKVLILHPVLFALSPVLYFLYVNKSELSFRDSDLLFALAATLVFAVAVWLIAGLIFRNARKGAALASLCVLLFFSYGHVCALVKGAEGPVGFAWASIFALAVLLLAKAKKDLSILTNFLNVVALFLVVFNLAGIVPYKLRTIGLSRPRDELLAEDAVLSAEGEEVLPDIYYLIFDRYARGDILKKEFNYDNGKFLDYLAQKGFYVARKSRANYPKTFLSLASSLNMKHLSFLTDELGTWSSDQTPVYEMLQDYKVWRFLEKRGYEFIHFGDWWEGTQKNRYADRNVVYRSVIGGELTSKFLKTTLLRSFIRNPNAVRDEPERNIARRRFFYQLDELAKIPDDPEPTFVFAHMLIPHEPYVFDRGGRAVTKEEELRKDKKENYLNQLVFLNKMIKRLIDQIIENSPRPPVIILQADEGPCSSLEEFRGFCGEYIDWRWLTDDVLQAHMGILNAYYLPGASGADLYPSITPVNTFRLIFNNYFGTNFKLLPDESYIFPDTDHPYDFINVTDKITAD